MPRVDPFTDQFLDQISREPPQSNMGGLGQLGQLGQLGALGQLSPGLAVTDESLQNARPEEVGVQLPGPQRATPEQLVEDRRVAEAIAAGQTPGQAVGGGEMSGERAAAMAALAGQLPQFGGVVGSIFDRLSDKRTKRSVAPAGGELDTFLRAIGG